MMRTTIRSLVPLAAVAGLALTAVVGAPRGASATVVLTGCADPFSLGLCTMAELVAGGTITVNDDKRFKNWTFSSSATGTGSTVDPANTTLGGLDDGGLDPGPGLNYNTGFDWNVFGDGNIGGTLTITWGYDVEVLDPTLRIKDNTLFVGAEPAGGTLKLTETIFTDATKTTQLGQKICTDQSPNFGSFTNPCASASFAPQSFIHVEKELVLTGGPNSGMAVFGIVQRFSQETVTTPEPASLGLLGVGLLALGGLRRRRQRAPG